MLHAPHMRFAAAFALVGWVLLVTTVGLAAVPWRWHHAFAKRVVPYATRQLMLVGITSMMAGALIVIAAFGGG